jgi:hypothetical protein
MAIMGRLVERVGRGVMVSAALGALGACGDVFSARAASDAPAPGAELPAECTAAADCSTADPAVDRWGCVDGECVPDDSSPRVVSVTPANDAVAVEPDSRIVIELSEPLDATTVTRSNVKLLDGETPIPGALSYADSKIVFAPEKPLALLTLYEVLLSTSVTDATGVGLAEAFSSKFSVRDGSWSVLTVEPGTFKEMSPTLQLNADGDALVAWLGKGSAPCPTSAAWFHRGHLLGAAKTFSKGGTQYCSTPNSAVSASGFALLSWFEEINPGQQVVTAEFRAGKWGPVTALSERFDNPAAVVAGEDGTMHYLGSYSDVRVWSTTPSGVWSNAGSLLGSHSAAARPQVAVAGSGDAVAAWRVEEGGGSHAIVVARYSNEGATWSPGVVLPGSSADGNEVVHGEPQVAFDDANRPIVVWQRQSELVSSRFTGAPGAWAAPVRVGGPHVFPPRGFEHEPPALAFDGQTFVVAFTVLEGQQYNTYVVRSKRGEDTWSQPELVSDATSRGTQRMPRLTADAHGNLLVVWPSPKAGGIYNLVAQRFNALTAEWSGPASIEGASMNVPELPLGVGRYALGGNQSGLAALMFADVPPGAWSTKLQLASFH